MKRYGLATIRSALSAALLCLAAPPAVAHDVDAAPSDDVNCLALNIYHEARGEPFVGKVAVGHVVLNRVADKRFPQDVCAVVKQGGWKKLHRCHFSWWCDGRSDRPKEITAWHESLMVAKLVRDGLTRDPTGGALWYHATYVAPSWIASMVRRAKIGAHIFYVANEETRPKAGV